MKRLEEDVIIAINAVKKVMDIFLGPFLTTYFIKKSAESMVDLSIYNIFSYMFLCLISFFVTAFIKNRFKIGMFRLGVVLNFAYIMTIIILKEKIIDYLALISILSGISAATYWIPYNLFLINKVENSHRTEFTVNSKIVSSIIAILCPFFLGSIITVTNYELTSQIILIISLIQIFLSFMLKPDENLNLPKFNLSKTYNKLRKNDQVKKILLAEFLVGMNVAGALETLITILIFNSFKTDMNLGIITSVANILAMFGVHIYGKVYKNKDDRKIILIASIIPVISLLVLLISQTNITVILYNFCYIIFSNILTVIREIRLFNLSNSYIVNKENQSEFLSIREGVLNIGRILGYAMLLLSGLCGNQIYMYILMLVLTLSLLIMGVNISKIEKFDK